MEELAAVDGLDTFGMSAFEELEGDKLEAEPEPEAVLLMRCFGSSSGVSSSVP